MANMQLGPISTAFSSLVYVPPLGLGGKRGAVVPGYGVQGPGVWKTRGLVGGRDQIRTDSGSQGRLYKLTSAASHPIEEL